MILEKINFSFDCIKEYEELKNLSSRILAGELFTPFKADRYKITLFSGSLKKNKIKTLTRLFVASKKAEFEIEFYNQVIINFTGYIEELEFHDDKNGDYISLIIGKCDA